MDECQICCESTDQFFFLSCCIKKICNNCIFSLGVPLCPFCRSLINEIKDDSRFRLARSLEVDYLSEHRINEIIASDLISSSPILEPSRILRRQIKRKQKLEEREIDVRRNIELSKQKKRQEHRREIDECIFVMEDDIITRN